MAELLADPEVSIIVNLTVPVVHAEVSLAILQAGKHVYSEKPLAVRRDEGLEVLRTAQALGLRVGCAPDTFLGGGQQTCRKLIDDGWIGRAGGRGRVHGRPRSRVVASQPRFLLPGRRRSACTTWDRTT